MVEWWSNSVRCVFAPLRLCVKSHGRSTILLVVSLRFCVKKTMLRHDAMARGFVLFIFHLSLLQNSITPLFLILVNYFKAGIRYKRFWN